MRHRRVFNAIAAALLFLGVLIPSLVAAFQPRTPAPAGAVIVTPQSIPEPASLILLGLGSALILNGRKRNRRS